MIRPCVITIAGSDSGGGAGVQADLRAISARGVHAAMAIAAVTAQNSRAVTAVEILPERIVEAQIDAVMSDLRPDTVKIGMLGSAAMVRLVARKLREWAPGEVVLDPVMIASSGARLLERDAVDALRTELIPLATVLTPNWPEAEELTGGTIRGPEELESAAAEMSRLGARAILFKGGHLDGIEIVDTLFEGGSRTEIRHRRIEDAEGHGTGCALAAAVAAGLALGESLETACRTAVELVRRALENRYAVGDSRPLFLGIEN
jgi:hydroxymethylpyrimidine/phosphomethylpyrimidine kinase